MAPASSHSPFRLPPLPIYITESSAVARFATSRSQFWVLFNILALNHLPVLLFGQIPRPFEGSLIGQLLLLNIQRGVPIYRNSSLIKLLLHNESVVGALANRHGRTINIRADKGVLLARGGFAKNNAVRQQYHPKPGEEML